jgi:RecJ-like exonuclease
MERRMTMIDTRPILWDQLCPTCQGDGETSNGLEYPSLCKPCGGTGLKRYCKVCGTTHGRPHWAGCQDGTP